MALSHLQDQIEVCYAGNNHYDLVCSNEYMKKATVMQSKSAPHSLAFVPRSGASACANACPLGWHTTAAQPWRCLANAAYQSLFVAWSDGVRPSAAIASNQ